MRFLFALFPLHFPVIHVFSIIIAAITLFVIAAVWLYKEIMPDNFLIQVV